MENIKTFLEKIKFTKLIGHFLLVFLTNMFIFGSIALFYTQETYNDNFKLKWYKAYLEHDAEALSGYVKKFDIKIKKIDKECSQFGFYKNNDQLVFCNERQVAIFPKAHGNINEEITSIFLEDFKIILFLTFFILGYLSKINPYYFSKVKNFKGDIQQTINNKLDNNLDITKEDLFYVEKDVIDSIEDDYSQFYTIRKRLFDLYIKCGHLGLLETQRSVKIIYKNTNNIKFLKEKKYIQYIGSKMSFFSSLYLTSTAVYFLFLFIFLIYNSFIFKQLFYYTSGGAFDEDILWYVYETVNITSNLGGNTEGVGPLEQLFLIYLTVIGVVLFGILLAIINDKIKISN